MPFRAPPEDPQPPQGNWWDILIPSRPNYGPSPDAYLPDYDFTQPRPRPPIPSGPDTSAGPEAPLPPENYPQGPLGPPEPVPLPFPGGYPFVSEAELADPNPVSEIPMDYGDIPIGTPPTPPPPLPMPPQFPSGGPLNPTELGEIDSSIPNPTRDEQIFGPDQFPLADFPQAPAPPASPQTPKLPNPFGGRGGR